MQSSSIPPRLLVDNSILSVSMSCWTGVATIKKGDEEIFGLRSIDERVFKRGSLILCRKDLIDPIRKKQQSLSSWLDTMGVRFGMIRGARLIKRELLEETVDHIESCGFEIEEMARQFAIDYESEIDFFISTIRRDQQDPDLAELRARSYLPRTSELHKKFAVSCCGMQISQADELESILRDERNRFSQKVNEFIHETAAEFRKCAVEAAIAFKQGIEKASSEDGNGKVHGKTVNSFRRFLDRFQNVDMLGDKQMTKALEDMKSKVFSVEAWQTSDAETMSVIKAHLDEVIRIGEDEGSAAAVADDYIINISSEEENIVQEDIQEIRLGQMSPGDDELETQEDSIAIEL